MKKIVSILVLVFTILIGSQSLVAQEQTIEQYASEKATELQEQFGLTESQKSAIYRAFYSKKINYVRYLNGHENEAGYQQNKDKVDNSFNHILKKTLGEENYAIYLEQNQNN